MSTFASMRVGKKPYAAGVTANRLAFNLNVPDATVLPHKLQAGIVVHGMTSDAADAEAVEVTLSNGIDTDAVIGFTVADVTPVFSLSIKPQAFLPENGPVTITISGGSTAEATGYLIYTLYDDRSGANG